MSNSQIKMHERLIARDLFESHCYQHGMMNRNTCVCTHMCAHSRRSGRTFGIAWTTSAQREGVLMEEVGRLFSDIRGGQGALKNDQGR